MDMVSRDDVAASRIAGQLGIGSGLSFQERDPGHYYSLKGA